MTPRARLAVTVRVGGRDEHEAEYHKRMVEVLSKGYTAEYEDVFTSIYPELSMRECALVPDILDMFGCLRSAWID